MADFDIFNPKISKVIKGIEGKMILIHSNERKVGKTTVGCDMPKPYYLRFEQGINAIDGIPYADITDWSDFKKVNKQLTRGKEGIVQENGKSVKKKPRDIYSTIIFDTVDVAIKWCTDYVCSAQGVSRLNDGNDGYGLWKEYENEWFKEINKLTNAGFTLYFISHSEEKKMKDLRTNEAYVQMYPKGDKRTIDVILDLVDFIGYVKSNGFDEKGKEVNSSVYFANTKEFIAGTRFSHMPKIIKEFSAKNIQDAIKLAIEMKEKETGNKSITQKELQNLEQKKVYTHSEILEEIKKYMMPLLENHTSEVVDINDEYLGSGGTPSQTNKKQLPQLEMILFDLQELVIDKGIKI